MPLPPTVQLDENGKPKRRRVTAVTVFTRELRDRRQDLRNLRMTSMQLISAGAEAFDQLSLEEQRRYEKMAKAENKNYDEMYGDQFRRDSEGAYISERDILAAEQREFERYTAKIVANLAGNVTDLSELVETEFVVGDVSPFVEADERDEGLYVPAEFGFVKFSLAHGILSSLHCIVQPRPKSIPVHLYSQCRDLIEDTHGIPRHSCPDAEESMVRLCIGLQSLCSQLPIFVPSERLVAMQKSLIYAFNDPNFCGNDCPFVKEISRINKTKVFPFESLFLAILNSNCLPAEKRMTGMLDQQISLLLDRRRFTGEEHACPLHRREDNISNCALMRAHSHAWTLLERAIKPFDLVWKPNHGPKELDTPVPQPVKRGWLTRGKNRQFGSSCPANLASSGGGNRRWQTANPRAYQPVGAAAPVAAAAAAPAGVQFYEPNGADEERYDDEVDEDYASQGTAEHSDLLEREFNRAVSVESKPTAARQDSGYVGGAIGGVGGAVGGGAGRGRGRPKTVGTRGPIIID